MGFIMTFSHMYIMYLDSVHLPSPSLVSLILYDPIYKTFFWEAALGG
jgi:hypothetical protein